MNLAKIQQSHKAPKGIKNEPITCGKGKDSTKGFPQSAQDSVSQQVGCHPLLGMYSSSITVLSKRVYKWCLILFCGQPTTRH